MPINDFFQCPGKWCGVEEGGGIPKIQILNVYASVCVRECECVAFDQD